MKKLLILSIFCGALTLASCEWSNVASEQTHTFKNDLFAEPVEFDFTNNKDSFQLYNVILSLKLNFDSVWYRQVPLNFSYVAPNGDSATIPIALSFPYEPATKENMQPSKEAIDSAWVFEQTILYGNSMKQGVSKFYFSPATNNDTLFGISGMTLRIERAK